MAFDRIRKVDLVGVGVIGLADTPALSTAEMQKKFEETAREVLMPAHNALVDKLNAEGASHIGAVAPGELETDGTVQGALEALNQAIDDKVQELGAGDMAKAVYDPEGAGVDVTVQVYTHTKSDNVHEFVGTGANGRVLMTDDVEPGDYVTVNGWEVDAYVGADSFADALAGQSLAGRWLTFVFDGVQINFKGGGGAVTVEGLAAENIVAGQTVTVKQGARTVAQVEGSVLAAEYLLAVGGGGSDQSGYGMRHIRIHDPAGGLLAVQSPNKDGGNAPVSVSTTLAVGLGVRKVRFRGVNVTLSLDGAAVGADWADRELTAGMTVLATLTASAGGAGVLEIARA